MNHLWVGIAVGVACYWLLDRTLLRIARRYLDPTHEKSIRRNLLDKMGYDSLVHFETAVKSELARRRGQQA